jgi:UDP-N-acetyl-D-mannosaminuronate dehydrogenase
MSKLYFKIKNKNATIGIIGLGYVGIPYLITFADTGFNTIGFDISAKRVKDLNKGISPINDIKNSTFIKVLNKDTVYSKNVTVLSFAYQHHVMSLMSLI